MSSHIRGAHVQEWAGAQLDRCRETFLTRFENDNASYTRILILCFINFSYPGRLSLENIVLSRFAADTNTVSAYVLEQPNGPIKFHVSKAARWANQIVCIL